MLGTFKEVDWYVVTVAKGPSPATVRNCVFIFHCIFSYKVVFFYKTSNVFVLYVHGGYWHWWLTGTCCWNQPCQERRMAKIYITLWGTKTWNFLEFAVFLGTLSGTFLKMLTQTGTFSDFCAPVWDWKSDQMILKRKRNLDQRHVPVPNFGWVGFMVPCQGFLKKDWPCQGLFSNFCAPVWDWKSDQVTPKRKRDPDQQHVPVSNFGWVGFMVLCQGPFLKKIGLVRDFLCKFCAPVRN